MRKLILSLAAAGALLATGLVSGDANAMTRSQGVRAAIQSGHHAAVVRHVRVARHFGHRHLHFVRHVWRNCSHVWNGRYHRNVRCTIARRVRVG
jgi:hypothetical protein